MSLCVQPLVTVLDSDQRLHSSPIPEEVVIVSSQCYIQKGLMFSLEKTEFLLKNRSAVFISRGNFSFIAIQSTLSVPLFKTTLRVKCQSRLHITMSKCQKSTESISRYQFSFNEHSLSDVPDTGLGAMDIQTKRQGDGLVERGGLLSIYSAVW